MARSTPGDAAQIVADVLTAMSNKHGQVDIRLDKVSLAMPGSPLALELNGAVSVVVHLRDLSDEERRAHVAHNVAAIRGK